MRVVPVVARTRHRRGNIALCLVIAAELVCKSLSYSADNNRCKTEILVDKVQTGRRRQHFAFRSSAAFRPNPIWFRCRCQHAACVKVTWYIFNFGDVNLSNFIPVTNWHTFQFGTQNLSPSPFRPLRFDRATVRHQPAKQHWKFQIQPPNESCDHEQKQQEENNKAQYK